MDSSRPTFLAAPKARELHLSPGTQPLFLVFAFLLLSSAAFAQPSTAQIEPKLMSMFPWAAQRGATIQAEVRGSDLDDARAVWFDAGAIEGRVLRVEKLNEPAPSDRGIASGGKEPQATYRAAIEVRIGAGTETGIYSLRIVTGRGLSNGLRFEVTRDRVEVEKPGPHPSVKQAQAVTPPATINGRLGDPGESDFYSFQARAGQALSFEVMTEDKYDPVLAAKRFAPLLALYRAGGSWFDPHRPSRLLFAEEASTDLMPVQARGTYRFQESGRYFSGDLRSVRTGRP